MRHFTAQAPQAPGSAGRDQGWPGMPTATRPPNSTSLSILQPRENEDVEEGQVLFSPPLFPRQNARLCLAYGPRPREIRKMGHAQPPFWHWLHWKWRGPNSSLCGHASACMLLPEFVGVHTRETLGFVRFFPAPPRLARAPQAPVVAFPALAGASRLSCPAAGGVWVWAVPLSWHGAPGPDVRA